MKIGILKADSAPRQFQPTHGDYPEMIVQVLADGASQLDLDADFETWDVERGCYPASSDDCDAYVITGSRKSVYDDEPWIATLADYIRELHAARKKLVGLCFGHQLVAEALGGSTQVAEVGWCVGVHNSRFMQRPWFVEADVDDYNLVVSHRDQVVRLPEDAKLLAVGQACPNSMFTVGDHILAMQGHPEFTRAFSRCLLDIRKEVLGDEIWAEGVASLDKPLARSDMGRWIIRFISSRQAEQP